MSATTTVHENAQGIDSPPVRGYQYKHGDRPLEGYVIQRGAGRGGFGEVYYAISDSGREVALKLITTYEQIELRGISQCMNLKSPHLVTIFDVRYGTDGRPWVIMEYIGGPSLRQLLDASPSGLGTQKAAFFLREIGKGLSYLHECGIVHRDLKPANIFYENGTVKICDYGLSKVISTSHHSGQTVTVGTVHYMAPEIGAGNYDRGIDIYALGALLFEMLTGQVPFFGSSTTEVLMKHLSSEVDTSALEEPFRTVVRKAMAKNPADRYQSVQEMVEAVFGSEHVRNSVSAFSPDSLTMVAGYAAQKAAHVPGADTFTPSDAPAPDGGKASWQCDRWGRMAGMMDRVVAAKKGEFAAAFGAKVNKSPDFVDPFRSTVGDPLRFWHRIVLSGIAVCMVGMVGGLVADHEKGQAAFVALMATGWATGMAMVAWYFFAPALRNESPWMTRLAIGGTAGIGSIIFSLPFWDRLHMTGTALAIFVGFILMNWPQRLSANRPERVVLWNVITGALLGFILSAMFEGYPPLAAVVLAGTSLAAGIAAPWSRGNRGGTFPASPASLPRPLTPTPPMPQPIPMPSGEPRMQQPVSPPMIPPLPPVLQPRVYSRPVPRAFRGIWLALFVGFSTLGLFLLMMLLAVRTRDEERALMCGFGTGALIFAAFALRRSRRMFHNGAWEYFFRPVVQLLCVQAILVSSSILLFGRVYENDMPPAIFFIVFPTIVLFVLTFFTGRGGKMTQAPPLLPLPATLPSAYSSSNYSISVGGVVLGFGRIVFNIIGSLVLTFALLMGLAVVTNLPGLFESGVVDPQFSHDMEQAFGTRNWPRIMVHIGATISFISAMIAAGLLLLPRRHVGAAHMFRAIVGIGVLFGGIIVLGHGLPDWGYVSQSNTPGVNLDLYLQSVRTPNVFLGGAMSMFGIFVLLWPARRRSAAPQVNYNFSPVMQQEPQIHHPT